MKRWLSILLCMTIVLGLVGMASASVNIKSFTLIYKKVNNEPVYASIASDSTSKAMAKNKGYATMVITANTCDKNNVYYIRVDGKNVSRSHYENKTKGTWLYYNKDIKAKKSVTLVGRPDSSVPKTTIKGSFGAG